MTWKKAVFMAIITGAVLFAAAGCGGDTGTTTPEPQSAQPIESATPAPPADNGTMPAPPEGFTPGERPAAPEIDWAAVAASLGVTEEQLREALGDSVASPPDLASAAATLGVTEEALREALGFPAGGPPMPGGPPQGDVEPGSEELQHDII